MCFIFGINETIELRGRRYKIKKIERDEEGEIERNRDGQRERERYRELKWKKAQQLKTSNLCAHQILR